ncbi:MAG: hypothetical protein QE164_03405 [Candidatus Nezhaarchaeota archaeon]|nr:hypothetical protein [Candidatus Nezhaarchaeota archaeon]
MKKGTSLEYSNSLTLMIVKLLVKVYQNVPSALIALMRLDRSRQLVDPSSKMLALSFSLGGARSLEPKVASTAPLVLNPCLGEELPITYLLQRSMKEVRGGLFVPSIRNLMTLVMTSIIIAPVPITLLALFHQDTMLGLLPLIASLLYGTSLQLTLLVLKKYTKLLA